MPEVGGFGLEAISKDELSSVRVGIYHCLHSVIFKNSLWSSTTAACFMFHASLGLGSFQYSQ